MVILSDAYEWKHIINKRKWRVKALYHFQISMKIITILLPLGNHGNQNGDNVKHLIPQPSMRI